MQNSDVLPGQEGVSQVSFLVLRPSPASSAFFSSLQPTIFLFIHHHYLPPMRARPQAQRRAPASSPREGEAVLFLGTVCACRAEPTGQLCVESAHTCGV